MFRLGKGMANSFLVLSLTWLGVLLGFSNGKDTLITLVTAWFYAIYVFDHHSGVHICSFVFLLIIKDLLSSLLFEFLLCILTCMSVRMFII